MAFYTLQTELFYRAQNNGQSTDNIMSAQNEGLTGQILECPEFLSGHVCLKGKGSCIFC